MLENVIFKTKYLWSEPHKASEFWPFHVFILLYQGWNLLCLKLSKPFLLFSPNFFSHQIVFYLANLILILLLTPNVHTYWLLSCSNQGCCAASVLQLAGYPTTVGGCWQFPSFLFFYSFHVNDRNTFSVEMRSCFRINWFKAALM